MLLGEPHLLVQLVLVWSGLVCCHCQKHTYLPYLLHANRDFLQENGRRRDNSPPRRSRRGFPLVAFERYHHSSRRPKSQRQTSSAPSEAEDSNSWRRYHQGWRLRWRPCDHGTSTNFACDQQGRSCQSTFLHLAMLISSRNNGDQKHRSSSTRDTPSNTPGLLLLS